jgi:hypothetical protein
MQIDLTRLRPSLPETELDARLPEPNRLAPVRPARAPADQVPDEALPDLPATAPTAAVPWLEPRLGGAAAIGSPSQYLPMLMQLHGQLSNRQDPIAVRASAAILEEVHNHLVLSAHFNSLIG